MKVARLRRSGSASPRLGAGRRLRHEQLESARRARPRRRLEPQAAASTCSALGTPKKATGTPHRVRPASTTRPGRSRSPRPPGREAAVKYVNDYMGGIGGHPVELDDLRQRRPPRRPSARCANQIVGKHPVAILGGADVGAPARSRSGSARTSPTSAASRSRRRVQRAQRDPVLSVSVGDNAAAVDVRRQDAGRQEGRADLLPRPAGQVDPRHDRHRC